jgi:hypothetical protein
MTQRHEQPVADEQLSADIAESAREMISYRWQYGRAQIGQFSHLQCSAAA